MIYEIVFIAGIQWKFKLKQIFMTHFEPHLSHILVIPSNNILILEKQVTNISNPGINRTINWIECPQESMQNLPIISLSFWPIVIGVLILTTFSKKSKDVNKWIIFNKILNKMKFYFSIKLRLFSKQVLSGFSILVFFVWPQFWHRITRNLFFILNFLVEIKE